MAKMASRAVGRGQLTAPSTGARATRTRRSVATIALLGCVSVGLAACGDDGGSDSASGGFTVGYAGLSNEFPFVADVNRGLEESAEAEGLELITLDNQLDPQVALQNADTLIQRNADVVIEFQTDQSIAGSLCEKFKSGGLDTKVIAIDIPHPPCAKFFGVNNAEAGTLAGEKLAEEAKERWGGLDRLVLLELPQSGELVLSRTNSYVDGIQKIFPDFSEEQVIRLDGKNTLEDSRAALENVMSKLSGDQHIGVGVVNDASGVGALRAIQAAGREDSFMIAGQTGTEEGRNEICAGSEVYIGSVAYFPEKYGEQLIDLAIRVQAGEDVPDDTYATIEWLNADNISEFYDC